MKMRLSFGRPATAIVFGLGLIGCLATASTSAQVVTPSKVPIIGRDNTFAADPTVPRPNTPPCTVTLFSNLEFADYNTKSFTYAPPKNCPGPWSKVVFKADFTVTEGRQYDRSEQFYLGGANLLFGTTAEPRASLSPNWHVENDVTDLSALLNTTQTGSAILGNFVGVYNGVTYDGIIYSTAQLVFFPVSSTYPAPTVPDVVIGIPGNGGAGTLNTTTDTVSQSVTLPNNTSSVYLDVISQSQSGDEFWYLCVPNDVANELESCGSTGFRETEISIDGTPAGVAPVYPWIFTGGIDPYLWEPIPGVQTLNFKPYRVDLTPFAGQLSDGKPHTVAISVFNADSYFASEATLLVYTDKGITQTKGKVLYNSLTAAPVQNIAENLVTDPGGDVTGNVTVTGVHNYTILGNLYTSKGLVYTSVDAELKFKNSQDFILDENEYKQNLTQSTNGNTSTTTTVGGVSTKDEQVISYPFTFLYDEVINPDGTATVFNVSDQKDLVTSKTFYPPQTYTGTTIPTSGTPAPYVLNVANEVSSSDSLFYDSSFNFTGHSGHSFQNYVTTDSTGYCYSRSLTSANSAITGYTDGAACLSN